MMTLFICLVVFPVFLLLLWLCCYFNCKILEKKSYRWKTFFLQILWYKFLIFNVLTHLKAFSIFMTLHILFVTYFSYVENCKRLKTWYQKKKITVASVQIIEESLFQWVHCKYLQGVIFAYFTHILLQLLLTFN